MNKTLSRIGAGIAILGILAAPLTSSAADQVLPIGGFPYFISGSGISSSATSITVTSFTIPQTGQEITDSDVSDTFYLTLEPGSRTRQEFVSCTTVTQNSGTSATFSGCTRGLEPITPYTASSSLRFAHAGGSTLIFSDAPHLLNQGAFKANDETITGDWRFPTPVVGANAATKTYVDGLQNGGTLSYDSVVAAGRAGETVATGTILYFKKADARWWKADTDVEESVEYPIIGIAQGAGTAGNLIDNGVLLYGLDTTQVGMTAGNNIFLSSTAGATTTATSTVGIGKAQSATELYVDTQFYGVGLQSDNRFTGGNIFTASSTMATTTFTGNVSLSGSATSTIGIASTTSFTSTFTWNRPTGLKQLVFEIIGGGGSGANDTNGGGGGGGGAYCKGVLPAASTSASITMTVGAAGSASSMGSIVIAGAGAAGSGTTGGAGGDCSGSFTKIAKVENFDGGSGAADTGPTPDIANAGFGGGSVYGMGGSGAVSATGAATGVLAGRAGSGYGSGGGGGISASGGAGAAGLIILTEVFQ